MRDFSILDASVIACAKEIGTTAILVYAVLDLYTGDDGLCHPSKRTIGEMIGLKSRSICSALSELERVGMIEITNINGGSNQYRLIPRAGRKNFAIPSQNGGKKIARDPGKILHESGSDTLSYEEELKNKSKRGIVDYSSDFERFWKLYPKKVGKIGAYREWQRAIKGTPIETIISAAEAYSHSDKGQGEYCWNPLTWLSQGHWEDDPASWKSWNGNGNGRAARKQDDEEFHVFNEGYNHDEHQS